jgi:hypothetical protein
MTETSYATLKVQIIPQRPGEANGFGGQGRPSYCMPVHEFEVGSGQVGQVHESATRWLKDNAFAVPHLVAVLDGESVMNAWVIDDA